MVDPDSLQALRSDQSETDPPSTIGPAINERPHVDLAWNLRCRRIGKLLLVLIIAGLAINTGLKIWSLVASPEPQVILSGTTATSSWQFVEEFPADLADELHFLLTDSGSQAATIFDLNNDMSPGISATTRPIDTWEGPPEAMADAASVPHSGRLARYDDAGKIIAFGVNTPLTFAELVADVELNCTAVISDEAERFVIFSSKNGTRWKCLLIEGDTPDSFLLCETIENPPDPH